MGQPQLKTDPRWTYLTASAEYLMQTGLHCPDASYVSLTLPSPETALGITDAPSGSCTLVTTIHRVVFTTESHDQGFSDHHDQIGTYQGSYSFFEAQVIDPSTGCDRVPRRRIQYNVHGGSDFRTHVNIWDRRDESLAGVGPGAAVWSQREEGKGMQLSAWLEGIRGGDVVRLVPKAFFQGWTNVVRHARIEIWAEFLLLPLLVDRPLLFEGVGFGDCPFYRRLQTSQKEIRLVVIEPVGHDGDVEAAVRLSLQHTSLADPDHLSYDALSYCWGEANDTEAICFADCESSAEDVKIHVRRNLHSALKRLRSVDKPIILWVDLICINQTDLQERGQQVALMGEIFASAQSVRVWLGEADTEIRKDFTIIRSIAQQYGAVPCPADLRLNHDSPTEQAPRRDTRYFNGPGSNAYG